MYSICKLSFFINLLNYYESGIVNIIISFMKPQILEKDNIEFFWLNTSNICKKYVHNNIFNIKTIIKLYNIQYLSFYDCIWEKINIKNFKNITILEFKYKIIKQIVTISRNGDLISNNYLSCVFK